MKITFDPRCNTAYLRLREKQELVDTIHVSDSLNIGMAPDGTVYGIELLNANEQLCQADHGSLTATNDAIGKSVEVRLPV